MGWEFNFAPPPHRSWAGCSEQSLLTPLAPASPGHFCSSSFRQPIDTPPQHWASPALTSHASRAAAARTSLQAGEKREISTGILFYIYFIPLYFCVTDTSEVSISEYPLLIESLKLELHIRSFKIPGVILGQSKSETRFSLIICLFFWGQSCTARRHRGQRMASSWGKYNSCPLHLP